jgi:hypothetical protein
MAGKIRVKYMINTVLSNQNPVNPGSEHIIYNMPKTKTTKNKRGGRLPDRPRKPDVDFTEPDPSFDFDFDVVRLNL